MSFLATALARWRRETGFARGSDGRAGDGDEARYLLGGEGGIGLVVAMRDCRVCKEMPWRLDGQAESEEGRTGT